VAEHFLHVAHAGGFEVDVVNREPAKLEASQAGGVKQLEDGAVAVSLRSVQIGLGEQAQDFFVAQYAFGHRGRFVEQGKMLARIAEQHLALMQEAQEGFDGPHLGD